MPNDEPPAASRNGCGLAAAASGSEWFWQRLLLAATALRSACPVSDCPRKFGGGMRAGKQAKLFESGKQWLDAEFPKLDRLLEATIRRVGRRKRLPHLGSD